jgi:hypothetical protein
MSQTLGNKQLDMKKVLLILFFAIPLFSFGQYQDGFMQEFYFGRQPSARAEALGKGYSSIDGDLATIFYNPAGTATLKGAEINTSFASPYYFLEKAKYNFISAGYNVNPYLTIGISRNHYTMGEEVYLSDDMGNPISKGYAPTTSLYSLNISSQPIKNLFIGLNSNYLLWKLFDESANSIYFDFGVIKKFEFAQKTTLNHTINIGASIKNLNYAKIKWDLNGNEFEADLPVITRYGVNYQIQLNKNWISESLNTFGLLVQADYQYLLNSDYHNGYNTGLELMFLEILSVRVGYYQESQDDYDSPALNANELSEFTYGLGLQIPLDKLTKIPLKINFDYASLPQPSFTKSQPSFENFSTYTLRVNYLLKK